MTMSATHVEMSDLSSNGNACSDFHKTLHELRLKGLFCDVTLLDDNHQSLEAHAVVLASGSSVLKSALSINQSCVMIKKQGLTVKIAGITKEVWQLLLDFLYLRRITVQLSTYTVSALYDAAKQLGIKALTSSLRALAVNMQLDLDLKGSSAAINITLAPTKPLTVATQSTQVLSADLAETADDARHISEEHTYGVVDIRPTADSPREQKTVLHVMKDTAPLPSNKPVACIYCKLECANKSALIEHLNSVCGGIAKKKAPGRGRKSIKKEKDENEKCIGRRKRSDDGDADDVSDDVDVDIEDDYDENSENQGSPRKKHRNTGQRNQQRDQLPCLNPQCSKVFHSYSRQMEHHRACIMKKTSWDIVDYFTEQDGLLIYCDAHFEPMGGAIETPSAHLLSGTKKTFTCSHCQYQSPRDKMYVHLAIVHGKRRPFHCKLCDARYAYVNSLCDHYGSAHGNIRLQCPQCTETFSMKHNLRRHILSAHKRKNKPIHPCRGCGKLFMHASHARRHETYHLPIEQRRKFVCELCDKAFLSKQDCFRHRQIHSGDRPHKCRKCSYTSLRRFNVVLHERKHGIVHGDWVCINCGRYFLSEARFQTHLRVSKHEGTHVSYLNIDADQDEEEFLASFRADMANAEYVELGVEGEVEGVEGVFGEGHETVRLSSAQLEELLGTSVTTAGGVAIATGDLGVTTGGIRVSAGSITVASSGEHVAIAGEDEATDETTEAASGVVIETHDMNETTSGVVIKTDDTDVSMTDENVETAEMDIETSGMSVTGNDEGGSKSTLSVATGGIGVVTGVDGQETVYIVQNAENSS